MTTENLDVLDAVVPDKAAIAYAERIFANDLLYRVVFAHCTPVEIVRASKTCRLLHEAAQDYFGYAFDINRSLSRYFKDPRAFRSLQARTGLLISGSFALQFFGRWFYPESDLDVYVPMFAKEEVGRYLLAQGYRFAHDAQQQPSFEDAIASPVLASTAATYFHRGIVGVFTFVKKSHHDPLREEKVQMVVVSRSPIEIILAFHSTCVMNVISHDKAISLYPKATFEDFRTLVCKGWTGQEMALKKYADRGWEIVKKLRWHEFNFDKAGRWVLDKHTWVISLPTKGVELRSSEASTDKPFVDPLLVTNWKLTRSGTFDAEISFDVVGVPHRLFPLINADKIAFDIVCRAFDKKSYAITNRPYWDNGSLGDGDDAKIVTPWTSETQMIVYCLINVLPVVWQGMKQAAR